jgi:hypothetical protein
MIDAPVGPRALRRWAAEASPSATLIYAEGDWDMVLSPSHLAALDLAAARRLNLVQRLGDSGVLEFVPVRRR